jgi:predicted NodU family carbamoyl transferase
MKRAQWPGLEDREYRISQGHYAAPALFVDGRVGAAAAEERLNRTKHSGDFPHHALRLCPEHAGLELEEVDEIAQSLVDHSSYRQMFFLNSTNPRLYEAFCARRHPNYLALAGGLALKCKANGRLIKLDCSTRSTFGPPSVTTGRQSARHYTTRRLLAKN